MWDFVGLSGLSVYVAYMIRSVQDGCRLRLQHKLGWYLAKRTGDEHLLVFVDFTELVLVAALKAPKLALTQADECPAVAVTFEQELIILLQALANTLLLEHMRHIGARTCALHERVLRREDNPEVEVAEEEQVRGVVHRCGLTRRRARERREEQCACDMVVVAHALLEFVRVRGEVRADEAVYVRCVFNSYPLRDRDKEGR